MFCRTIRVSRHFPITHWDFAQEKIEKEHRHQAELSGTTAITAYQRLA
jgi:hypothetical protein